MSECLHRRERLSSFHARVMHRCALLFVVSYRWWCCNGASRRNDNYLDGGNDGGRISGGTVHTIAHRHDRTRQITTSTYRIAPTVQHTALQPVTTLIRSTSNFAAHTAASFPHHHHVCAYAGTRSISVTDARTTDCVRAGYLHAIECSSADS